ncbi:Papain fold toxin 1, glutamine deamidase [Saccharopolyspora antimicrobica]|uniref:Papain fold toxin 1 (Glutamine deamidase) of polymorphic toxin system n=1 Tax=Saccharopolyspora antimicrobica TaxID=455193 RepID=A0A1I5I3T0_9PSEU|nr:toxin glutamine deamidase domain-containing protein [Saccharopolyspora antimicrobica]RKT83055.1 papain fold toxin 1 (glutamine deamidase) of polymorphic toxin system [Saccharopolyspora antimicrobica]SFO55215.1 Papain fold toxin 1, glutamine deamidase [Saccharopolyspora antimicrobica]
MAMVVSPEVAKLFQVLTGEEWPDANEDQLRALAAEWTAAAQTLAELGPGLRSAVQAVRSEFAGEAAEAFVRRVASFVEGDDLISAAAELFNGLAKTLTDLALDVEYMKIVTIASLVALIAEIAWATAMAPFTGGATMAWLAARMAIVRFLIKTLLGRVLMQVLSTAVFSIAFQLLIDVVAQLSQFAMGTRTEWDTDKTKNAAGVGAMGAALALPIGGLGKVFGSGLNNALNAAFAKKFGKDWAKNGVKVISEISTESFHEMMTEALYKYATEGEFELNPYAATAGAASGAGSAGGSALGDKLASAMQNGPGGGDRSGGNSANTGGSGGNREISGGDSGDTSTPPTSPSTETPGPSGQNPPGAGGQNLPGAGGQNPPVVQAQANGGNQPPSSVSTGNSGGTNQPPGSSGQQETSTSTGNVPPAQTADRSSPHGPPNQIGSRQDLPGGSQSSQGTSGQQNTTAPGNGQTVENPGGQGNPARTIGQQGPSFVGPQGSGPTSGQQSTTTPDTVVDAPQSSEQNPPVVQNESPQVQHGPPGNQQPGTTVEQPNPSTGQNASTGQNTSGNQVNPPGDQQQASPNPVDQTTPTPVDQTVPSPIDQTTPSGIDRTVPNPIEQITPSPVDQTVPSPIEQTTPTPVDQTGSQIGPNPVDVSEQTGTAPPDMQTGRQSPGSATDVDFTTTTPDPNRGLSGNQQVENVPPPLNTDELSNPSGRATNTQLPLPAEVETPTAQQQDGQSTSRGPLPEAPNQEIGTETTNSPVQQDDPDRQANTSAPPQDVEAADVQRTTDGQVQPSQDDPPLVQQTSNPAQQSQNSGQQTATNQQTGSAGQQPGVTQQSSDFAQQQPNVIQQQSQQSSAQQTPTSTQQTSNPAQQQVPPAQQQTPSLVQSTQNPGQTSGSTTAPGSSTLPSTQSTTQRIGQGTNAPKHVSTLKTSSSTTVPGMTPNHDGNSSQLSPQQVVASIGLPEVEATSSRNAPESYELSTLPTGRTEETSQHIAVQQTDQQNTGNQDDTRSSDSTRQDDPFADVVAEATRNARETAATRQAIESDLGKINAAGTKARHHLGAIQRSMREARGAVIATGEAFGPNPQRTAQAQQRFDAAEQNRIDRAGELAAARDRHGESVQRLDEARTRLGEARTDGDPNAIRRAQDGIRRWKESADLLGERLRTADQAHSEAAAAAAGAKQDLDRAKATQESANAANTAYDKVDSARNTATDAVSTITGGNTRAQDSLRFANDAANRSARALDDLNGAINNANNAKTAADGLTGQANQAGEDLAALENQRNDVDRDLRELHGNRPDDDQQRADWNTRVETLENELTDLDGQIEAAKNNAEDLATRAQGAREQYDNAVNDVENIRAEIDSLREQARAAETAAANARRAAENAAEQAEKAKEKAGEAAEQGQYEQGLTELSFLPHGSELQFETLGPRDGLIDALTELTGADRDVVATEIGGLSDAELVSAIGDGKIRVGGVDVAVRPDLYRPDDTRAAPPNQQPSTRSTDSSGESGRPQSESTSTTVPIRIPLMFVSPLDLAGAVMRPMVYVGGAVKRSQRFESSLTFTDNSGSSRSYVPTRMELGLSVPGKQASTSIDAGLRTPKITRGDGITAPLPDTDFKGVKPVLAGVPDQFGDVLGNSREASASLTNQLFAGTGTPDRTTIDGKPVTITPVGDAQVSYVGTTSVDSSSAVSLGRSWQTTKGSDAAFGAGLYGGSTPFYVGGFVDFTSGLTDGSTPGADDSVTQTSGDHELVYEVSRDMRVGNGHTDPADGQPQSTVRTRLQVPVWQARDLGLPLPPHLAEPSTPTPNANQPYRFGRDDIKFVDRDQVSDFVTGRVRDTADGLSDQGRDAIKDKFRSPEVAKNTIYDAMHGGAHASWVKGGRTHFVDIYAIPAAPESTTPSGQQESSTEVKHSDKFQRGYNSSRTARIGAGGAFMAKHTDSPNPDAPKATPENGLPNPYQGGPTQTTAGPRATAAVTWDGGISNKSGYTGKDGRAAKYGGDMRDYQGPLDLVVVHGSTKNPNWAQHFFLGDRMLFGPKADARYAGPSKAELDQALAGGEVANQDIHRGRVDDAIRVSTAADKLDWGTRPLPASTTQPGTYLGTPPALPSSPVTSELFGDYANVENVRITPNNTEAVDIALAKRIEQLQPDGTGSTTVRKPPKGSGNWPAWAEKTFTDTRTGPDGAQQSTDYVYKSSELTRPGTTAGNAVRDFQGKVGSLGTATQGLGELSSSTGKMFREGRTQDFNGTLNGEATYHSPRLVDVRAESTLKRNQAGEQVAGSTKSWGVGGEVEISANVMPKREGKAGAMIGGLLSGGGKYGRSHALDLTTGGKQDTEYQGPTALVTMDVRYRYWADMALRSMFSDGNFGDTSGARPDEVTVDEPDGVLVELPVNQAIAMFEALGLPVSPELSAMVPPAKEQVGNPSHTVLPGPGDYASYSDTSVTGARLTGDDPMGPVRDRLGELGVTDAERQRDVVNQVNALLNTPAGHQWLQDPLAGQQGLISVSHSNAGVEDVVDIRVKATPVAGPPAPSQTDGTAPDKLTRSSYVSTSLQDKNSTTWSVNAALNAGVRSVETPSVPPGQPGENGQVQKAPPNPGASSGAFTPQVFGGGKTWKTENVLDGSGSEKVTTKVDNDKVGRDTRLVDYELEITRRRQPMPGIDTLGAGIPKHLVDLDKGVGDAPIRLSGEVDLVSPSSDASPALRKPGQQPGFEVLDGPREQRPPGFTSDDAFRIESIGTDTAKAVHDAVYAQLSTKLPNGNLTADQIAAATRTSSEFTRPGSNSEYVAHTTTKGSSLHNAANTMFTGGDYQAGNTLGTKHPLYDSLFDLKLSGDVRPENLTFVAALPDDTTMNLSREREVTNADGTTKTVTTSYGPSVSSYGSQTHQAAGPSPTSAVFAPPASGTVGHDRTTAESSKDGKTTGFKHEGRSYLFRADVADIYSDVRVHGSNWTHKPITAIKDLFSGHGHPRNSSVKITSHDDLHVRVWENTALDKGLLTLHDVWDHAGKLPDDQATYGVTGNARGATIHPAGQAAPATGQPAPNESPGRNLHVAPGVTLDGVKDFVGKLPKDMRPATYTVDPGLNFGDAEVREAVAGLPEPPKPDTTTETGNTTNTETTTNAENTTDTTGNTTTEPVVTDTSATELPVTEVPATEVPLPETPLTETPVTENPAAIEAPVESRESSSQQRSGVEPSGSGQAHPDGSTTARSTPPPVVVPHRTDAIGSQPPAAPVAGDSAETTDSDSDSSSEYHDAVSDFPAPTDAQRVERFRPGPGEREDGRYDMEALKEGRQVWVSDQPSEFAVFRLDDGSTAGMTRFMVRKWFADSPDLALLTDRPGGTALHEHLYGPGDGNRVRKEYGLDQREEFIADLRERRRESWFTGQQEVVTAVNELTTWVTDQYPPDQYSYVGLGRSPAPVMAALQSLGHDAVSVPLSSFRPGPPSELNSILDRVFNRPGADTTPLTDAQWGMLRAHFQEFVGTPDRDIVLIDYTQTALSLVSAQFHLQQHLGPDVQVHALAMHQDVNSGDVQATYSQAAVPVSFWEARSLWEWFADNWGSERSAQRAEWQQRFTSVSLGADGPFGDRGKTLGESFKEEAFDNLAEYGSYKLLEQNAETFEQTRPKRHEQQDTDSAYQALGDAVREGRPDAENDQPSSVDVTTGSEPRVGPSTQNTDSVGGAVEHRAAAVPGAGDVLADESANSGKRSRAEFEEDGPATVHEPSHQRPIPERLVPPAQGDTDLLLAAVPPGTRFAPPASFAGLINGSRSEQGRDVNCVDAALAFHETYHGNPRVAGTAPNGVPQGAGTAAAEGLGYAPELFGQGTSGLAEVIDRVTRAGHGADALVVGFPRSGQGHAWNVVNHHGEVSIVDAQAGTVRPATTDGFSWLDRVYAIPVDAEGNYVEDAAPAPQPPVNPDAYATAQHERAQLAHEMRRAAAAGEEIPVPGTGGRLVPSLGGLRLVGAAITAELAADLASLTNRDLIALVIGPDAEYPEPEYAPVPGLEELKFPPRGRPERITPPEA